MHPRTRVVVIITVCATVTAAPAWAHPGFRPDEVAAGEQTEVGLAIAHDCEVPGGGTSPTTVVDVQVPDGIAEVQPVERDGWTLNLSGDADGSILRAEWARDEGTPEADPPVFRMLVTPATQESVTTIPWKVYQGCESGEYRWGAGSEDEPSVDLTVTPGTYTSPPAATASASEPSLSATSSSATTPGGAPQPTPTAEDDLVEGDSTAVERQAAGTGPPWALLLLVLATIGVGAAWWVRQRGAR